MASIKTKRDPDAMIAPVGTGEMPTADLKADDEIFDKTSCDKRAKGGQSELIPHAEWAKCSSKA